MAHRSRINKSYYVKCLNCLTPKHWNWNTPTALKHNCGSKLCPTHTHTHLSLTSRTQWGCVCVSWLSRASLHWSIHPTRQLFGHAWHPARRIYWKLTTSVSLCYRMCWVCVVFFFFYHFENLQPPAAQSEQQVLVSQVAKGNSPKSWYLGFAGF